MKSIADLSEYYRTELRPILESFEVRRKSVFLWLAVIGLVTLVASGVLLAIGMRQNSPAMGLFGLIPGAIIFGIVAYFRVGGYKRDFKDTVLKRLVSFIDPGLRYSEALYVPQHIFSNSRLFEHRIDRYRGEDNVSGTVGKTEMRFSEIHAEYKTRTRNSKGQTRTEWHTVFKGLFFNADFNKDFKGTTVIVPDVAERALGGWLGNLLQSMNFTRSGELIKLENPDFEKYFAVYGDDQIEARYILTPRLMELLVEFRERKDTGGQVFVSFANSCVNIAIATNRDRFEPRIVRSLVDFEMIKEFYRDFTMMIGIVEDMDLNTRIWTKE